MAPATATKGNRDITTSRIVASCVKADTIVESETGDKLSPKAPPANTATASIAGSDPKYIPAGYKTGINAITVPVLVPVPVANIAATINANAVNNAPLVPDSSPNHNRPSINPPSAISFPKTPANIQAVIITIPFLSPIPLIIELLYSLLSFAKNNPITIAIHPPAQNAC